MVLGGFWQPHPTVMVDSITQAAVTQVLQMLVVDTAAGHPAVLVGGAPVSVGEMVLTRVDDVWSWACVNVASSRQPPMALNRDDLIFSSGGEYGDRTRD